MTASSVKAGNIHSIDGKYVINFGIIQQGTFSLLYGTCVNHVTVDSHWRV